MYLPPFHGQINSADPLGAYSCVSYAFSYAIDGATNGRLHPSGDDVRDLTGDERAGGLELSQCAAVARKAYGLLPVTGVFTREVYEARMASGKYISVLIGGYRPIGATRFAGQPGGVFNHAVAEFPGLVVMDPLADGRHGVYDFHGEAYPLELVRQFAANLRLSNGSVAGDNHFEATMFTIEHPVAPSPPNPHVRVLWGTFNTYTVHRNPGGGLRAVGSSLRRLPMNTLIPVSMREYQIYVGPLASSKQVLMRQVASGPFAGLWVIAHGNLPFSL